MLSKNNTHRLKQRSTYKIITIPFSYTHLLQIQLTGFSPDHFIILWTAAVLLTSTKTTYSSQLSSFLHIGYTDASESQLDTIKFSPTPEFSIGYKIYLTFLKFEGFDNTQKQIKITELQARVSCTDLYYFKKSRMYVIIKLLHTKTY